MKSIVMTESRVRELGSIASGTFVRKIIPQPLTANTWDWEKCPYQVGETIYVREAWAPVGGSWAKHFLQRTPPEPLNAVAYEDHTILLYKGDKVVSLDTSGFNWDEVRSWQSAIFMPERVARYKLLITERCVDDSTILGDIEWLWAFNYVVV